MAFLVNRHSRPTVEIGGIAKALAFEGMKGWSLERKVCSLIDERDGYKRESEEKSREIERFTTSKGSKPW
jgi:hypothetical protein